MRRLQQGSCLPPVPAQCGCEHICFQSVCDMHDAVLSPARLPSLLRSAQAPHAEVRHLAGTCAVLRSNVNAVPMLLAPNICCHLLCCCHRGRPGGSQLFCKLSDWLQLGCIIQDLLSSCICGRLWLWQACICSISVAAVELGCTAEALLLPS